MGFYNSSCFYFILGTLWFATATINFYEDGMSSGIYFISILGIYFYVRGVFLVIKHRRHNKK